MVFNFSYWSDGKCQEKLKTMRMQNLEPISIQAQKVNAVIFTFIATCGRKLCTGYTLYTARADEHKNKSSNTAVLPRRTLTIKLALSLRTREISSIG